MQIRGEVSPRTSVLIVTASHSLDGDLLDLSGPLKVWKTLTQVDRLMRDGELGHLRENRRAEGAKTRREGRGGRGGRRGAAVRETVREGLFAEGAPRRLAARASRPSGLSCPCVDVG